MLLFCPSAKTKEETVYDEVKVKNETAEQPADTNTQHSGNQVLGSSRSY